MSPEDKVWNEICKFNNKICGTVLFSFSTYSVGGKYSISLWFYLCTTVNQFAIWVSDHHVIPFENHLVKLQVHS